MTEARVFSESKGRRVRRQWWCRSGEKLLSGDRKGQELSSLPRWLCHLWASGLQGLVVSIVCEFWRRASALRKMLRLAEIFASLFGLGSLSFPLLGCRLAHQTYISSNVWDFYVHLVFLSMYSNPVFQRFPMAHVCRNEAVYTGTDQSSN